MNSNIVLCKLTDNKTFVVGKMGLDFLEEALEALVIHHDQTEEIEVRFAPLMFPFKTTTADTEFLPTKLIMIDMDAPPEIRDAYLRELAEHDDQHVVLPVKVFHLNVVQGGKA